MKSVRDERKIDVQYDGKGALLELGFILLFFFCELSTENGSRWCSPSRIIEKKINFNQFQFH